MPKSGPSEKEFTEQILTLAKLRGFKRAHFRPARVLRGGKEIYETPISGDGKGWPDLVLIRKRDRLGIAAELKVGDNMPTPEQLEWLDFFAAVGFVSVVWYPADWPKIEQLLA